MMDADGCGAAGPDAAIIDMDGQPAPEDLESGDEGDIEDGDAIVYHEEDRQAEEEALEGAADADLAAAAAAHNLVRHPSVGTAEAAAIDSYCKTQYIYTSPLTRHEPNMTFALYLPYFKFHSYNLIKA